MPINKEQAWGFIHKQLDGETVATQDDFKKGDSYGKVELTELLNYIYGDSIEYDNLVKQLLKSEDKLNNDTLFNPCQD